MKSTNANKDHVCYTAWCIMNAKKDLSTGDACSFLGNLVQFCWQDQGSADMLRQPTLQRINEWIFLKHLSCDILSFILSFFYPCRVDMTHLGASEKGGSSPISSLSMSTLSSDCRKGDFSALLIERSVISLQPLFIVNLMKSTSRWTRK